MTLGVFLAVLGAAFLHAMWNAVVKASGDKALSMTAMIIGHTPLALLSIVIAPMPDPAAWPLIAVGAALHVGYQLFLQASYRIGDLSQVYPLARGLAPLIVAAVSVLALGVALSPSELIAVALIACGILSLALARPASGGTDRRAAAYALITGVFIAAYSLVDGIGARSAGTALGFYGWLSVLNGIAFTAIMRVRRPTLWKDLDRRTLGFGLIGGSASYIAFAIVLWAMTKAPIALVTALRETSIIVALFIGVFVLKERLSLRKLLSTFLTISGAVVLRLAR